MSTAEERPEVVTRGVEGYISFRHDMTPQEQEKILQRLGEFGIRLQFVPDEKAATTGDVPPRLAERLPGCVFSHADLVAFAVAHGSAKSAAGHAWYRLGRAHQTKGKGLISALEYTYPDRRSPYEVTHGVTVLSLASLRGVLNAAQESLWEAGGNPTSRTNTLHRIFGPMFGERSLSLLWRFAAEWPGPPPESSVEVGSS